MEDEEYLMLLAKSLNEGYVANLKDGNVRDVYKFLESKNVDIDQFFEDEKYGFYFNNKRMEDGITLNPFYIKNEIWDKYKDGLSNIFDHLESLKVLGRLVHKFMRNSTNKQGRLGEKLENIPEETIEFE